LSWQHDGASVFTIQTFLSAHQAGLSQGAALVERWSTRSLVMPLMNNPWLDIPLADYEAHMALPQVGQSQLLSDVFDELLKRYIPQSVAVVGCAGGNGFERIRTAITGRVVGIDVNPQYIEQVYARFHHQIPTLDLFAHDIESEQIEFEPVELVFAGLFFEYVDVDRVLKRIHSWLRPGGILGSVLQLIHPAAAAVTPSQFSSLQTLARAMTLVSPTRLRDRANACGFQELASRQLESPVGKRFQVQSFGRTSRTSIS
jgi:SAM-dependent methyltransferase